MKTIVITGPSGSGKSSLANRLCQLFNDSILIKTDSYYKDNIFIKILSIFKFDIYDRFLSIKKKEINNSLISIYNKKKLVSLSKYNFKRKKSSILLTRINYKGANQFLIVEGIFSYCLDLNYQKSLIILCEEDKQTCINRRISRDKSERGRNSRDVKKKFDKSWFLFYKNISNFLTRNKVITLNPADKASFDKLVITLQKEKITKKNIN